MFRIEKLQKFMIFMQTANLEGGQLGKYQD